MESNYWQMLKDGLTGKRPLDEKTFVSAAILAEKLERLKKTNALFEDVELSPAVKKLMKEKSRVAIC